jgi:hypothetical protein
VDGFSFQGQSGVPETSVPETSREVAFRMGVELSVPETSPSPKLPRNFARNFVLAKARTQSVVRVALTMVRLSTPIAPREILMGYVPSGH